MIFGINVYHVKTVCHMQEWLLSLADLLSYLPGMNFIRESLCAQYLYTLRCFDDNWLTYISGQEGVSRERMVAPPCCSLRYLHEPTLEWEACALNNSYAL